MHLRLRLPLHGDDGGAAASDDDAHVVAQLHLGMQNLRVTASVDSVEAVIVKALFGARPIARPELSLPVVAASGEQVSGRVPFMSQIAMSWA
eukprot:CAMPEP_0172552106 /NCGR_PEP_ID=MMETSP1067-20121228/43632_1 /TAXON_ID=265564 ORGANISM="Thalassiosira punctigera, Strain Tpunct2005C2" /NCGR_SAMPLE_ID=MMETSP1067 /ASSEMBLY_ACC=CAM_ASM_000444 /LENGTH=91 /DNA_ID=CAMNT_0013340025 /DNA_START=341 /DNA_END=617 /DNA_ORIENTATION=+